MYDQKILVSCDNNFRIIDLRIIIPKIDISFSALEADIFGNIFLSFS